MKMPGIDARRRHRIRLEERERMEHILLYTDQPAIYHKADIQGNNPHTSQGIKEPQECEPRFENLEPLE